MTNSEPKSTPKEGTATQQVLSMVQHLATIVMAREQLYVTSSAVVMTS